ncbi:MAG: pyrroline-5-carboxylate reductase [Pseudomonadota bacterium]
MKHCNIAFIGGGNMATSLIGGLLAEDIAAENIYVADPDAAKLEALRQRYGVHIGYDNAAIAAAADVLVLAVKPQVMKAVVPALAPVVKTGRPLVVSIAAGIRMDDLGRWLGGQPAIVRTMPNTPALVRAGATALCANAQVSDEQRDLAESIMRAVGLTIWLEDEAQMDAVTALSGSGPAYFFLVMEAMERAGRDLGLPPETARVLTLQTAYGAAKMALENELDTARLRANVTSPGGTTERAIQTLQAGGLEDLFAKALQAACARSRELAEMLGAS